MDLEEYLDLLDPADLDRNDAVGIAARCDVCLDMILDELLGEVFPEAVDWSEFNFANKVTLAFAVKRISSQEAKALREFRKLRNKIVHEAAADWPSLEPLFSI